MNNELPKDSLFIRAGSHRARHKIDCALGREARHWYSFHERHAIEIRPDEWDKVKHIRGVTKARIAKPQDLHPCWKM
jgi:hypothetical protein